AVSDVIALQTARIKPAPEFSGTMPTEHIIGLAAVEQDQGQRMLILLDIEKLMGSASMGLVTQLHP
ncbi:MAG: chemotaxis protein CheW, partial [Giesbergeria sp.]|nr:chemotaxis protein CheW [Giesbergeria sp.]